MIHFLVWLTHRPKRQREAVNTSNSSSTQYPLLCLFFTCLGTVCKVYLQLPLMSLLWVAAAVLLSQPVVFVLAHSGETEGYRPSS